jgi:hypothetical protein
MSMVEKRIFFDEKDSDDHQAWEAGGEAYPDRQK